MISAETSSNSPRVSIGMPVYNGEDVVAEAIESVLSQTFSDLELIICDNCSSDRTEEVCRKFAALDPRIRYYRNAQNLGAAKNFNRTFELSRGEYFKWLTHDDVIAPTFLQRCVEKLDQCGPGVVLCHSQRMIMNYDGQVLGPDPKVRWFEAGPPYDQLGFSRLMRVPNLLTPIFGYGLMRREVLAKTRLFGPYIYADLVLVEEMRLLGEFREIAEPLFYTRLHKETDKGWYKKTARLVKQQQKETWAAETALYDPSLSSRGLRPERKLFLERLRSVNLFGGPWYKKLWYYTWVIYGQVVVRSADWLKWPMRAIQASIWSWWDEASAAQIRRARDTYLPHRMWVLFSGLRNRDQGKLALALARATPETQQALADFVARKLSNRPDPYAKAVLEDWLDGCCPIRKSAAARAIRLPRCDDESPLSQIHANPSPPPNSTIGLH